MDQNRLSDSGAVSGGSHSLRDLVNRDRLNGLAAILIGMSQVPLAVMFADVTGYVSLLLIMASGGFLLIGIGVNVFRGREAFHVWSESKRVAWLDAIVTCILAVVVAVATFLILA